MEKRKQIYKNNKCKMSAPTWDKEFELPGGLCFIPDIQELTEYSMKTHEAATDNTFKTKTRYYLELLTLESTKLLGSTKSRINKDKNGVNVLHLQIAEVILVSFNIVNNDYQQDSRVWNTFFLINHLVNY